MSFEKGRSPWNKGKGLWRANVLTYTSWQSMLQRCRNPKADKKRKYYWRGITVCERWNEFKNFLADMGPRPSAAHTIDRINTNGNYEPSNCRWATKREQKLNSSSTRWVTINGQRKSVIEWAEASGLTKECLLGRLNAGWPEGKLLSPSRRAARQTGE